MHEMALIEAIMDAVRTTARSHGLSRVIKIRVVVGELTMVLPDSLRLAFTSMSEDPFWRGAELEIEVRCSECRCRTCGIYFRPGALTGFTCPECGGTLVDLVQGRELYIDFFEGE